MKRWGISLVALVVVVIGGLSLWMYHETRPATVFARMLANNLSTAGVTREIKQTGNGLSVDQFTQLQLGAQPTAHALTIFTSQTGGRLETEEVSSPQHDFVRYRKISSPAGSKPIDTSKVVGQWAELQPGSDFAGTASSGLFDQSIDGVLPLANLQPEQRKQLLSYIADNDVFTYDASKVKRATVAGKKVYQYPLQISPAAYVSAMQRFDKLIGGTAYKDLDANSFVGSAPISATVSVAISSGELVQLTQSSSAHTETYSGYGITQAALLPKATLTTTELEKRITSLQ